MTEQFEYAKLTVDAVILKGLDADLGNDNAVSKNYVDLHITSAINALVDGAVPAMDTLKELGVALNNASGDLASSLVSQITAVNSAITAEAASRSASDATQATNFDNEKTLRDGYRAQDRADAVQDRLDRVSAFDNLNFMLSEESSSRVGADNSMNAKIDDEVLVRTSEVSRIETNFNDANLLTNGRINDAYLALSSEVQARESNVNFVNSGLESEIQRAQLSETNLQGQITAEITARTEADTGLRAYVDSNHFGESNARIAENGVLNQRISDEIINRENDVYQVSDTLVQVSSALNSRCDGLNNSVTALGDSKLNKDGGVMTGDLQINNSYLKFSDFWRVSCSNDGSKILFQHKKADGVWRTAVPFICSV